MEDTMEIVLPDWVDQDEKSRELFQQISGNGDGLQQVKDDEGQTAVPVGVKHMRQIQRLKSGGKRLTQPIAPRGINEDSGSESHNEKETGNVIIEKADPGESAVGKLETLAIDNEEKQFTEEALAVAGIESNYSGEENEVDEDDLAGKFSHAELETCIKVLQCFDGKVFTLRKPKFRALRKAGKVFFEAAGEGGWFSYQKAKSEQESKRLRNLMKNRRKMLFKSLDKKKTESAALRAERVSYRQLGALIDVREAHPALPSSNIEYKESVLAEKSDTIQLPNTETINAYASHVQKIQKHEWDWDGGGHVQSSGGGSGSVLTEKVENVDMKEVPDDIIDKLQFSDMVTTMVEFYEGKKNNKPAQSQDVAPVVNGSDEVLVKPRACYICKSRFFHLHHFYDQLCPQCAELNWRKRNQSADLKGKIILLTGSRIKIGHEAGLKLLRAGATLIATSRFPKDCVMRYYKHKDSSDWMHNLHVYGIDLRDLPAVHNCCNHLATEFGRLDAIVNNAAQTVRRPPIFYSHLLPVETVPTTSLPAACQASLKKFSSLDPNISLHCHLKVLSDSTMQMPSNLAINSAEDVTPNTDEKYIDTVVDIGMEPDADALDTKLVAKSAVLSQIAMVKGDDNHDVAQFPEGQFDKDAQQLDLREKNSWTMLAEEVHLPELVEVHAINSMAPFILVSSLYSLLCAHKELPRYVINVSAMEAKFYRHKTPFHPHTNMAKAALNMFTRTSASSMAKDGVFMNSIDTGWITDEKPLDSVVRVNKQGLDPCPIDEVDAAARILDPIMSGDFEEFGKFYKDYFPTEW